VRPSWHIACAAMAMKSFGQTFDIQTGSTDLVFPHHENDLAISEALTGKPLAHCWIHNELVKEKNHPEMPQEKALTLRDLFNRGYTGREVRFWLVSMHYRKAMDFSWSKLDVAKKTVSRFDRFVDKLRACQKGPIMGEIDQLIYDLKQKFIGAMDDDLNISQALAALFDFIHSINRTMDSQGLDLSDRAKIEDVLSALNSVLMIMDLTEAESSRQLEELIRERTYARQKGDWARADHLRGEFRELGVEVTDTKHGTTWRKIKEVP
jgi:cysteinyl-tRNA synthetase